MKRTYVYKVTYTVDGSSNTMQVNAPNITVAWSFARNILDDAWPDRTYTIDTVARLYCKQLTLM